MRNKRLAATAGAVLLIGSVAACGGDEGDDGGAASDEPVVVGTTDTVTSLDPAGSYDLGSWTLVYNVYQNLMHIPAGGSTPEPDATESC